jgi:23S rRNA (cytosine1962-C5)-methyltransferase
MPTLTLKPGKEAALQRRHPWIFSGAFVPGQPLPEKGDWVHVADAKGRIWATGTWNDGSIAVRVAAFSKANNPEELVLARIQQAWKKRQRLGYGQHPDDNLFRLFFGEGDGLPGLVIDVFADVAVVQCHDWGMYRSLDAIVRALQQLDGLAFSGIYHRSRESLHHPEVVNGWVVGGPSIAEVRESGLQFLIEVETGQKTGFFIDQRENRRLVGRYAHGKRVLNAFSYTGGFSVHALKGGAEQVVSVDLSAPAIDLAHRNAAINQLEQAHQGVVADVFDYLKSVEYGAFDLIVLDPPAFAKSKNTSHNALQGYKRINQMALSKLAPGGLLFTFSCSQHISAEMFEGAVRAAAIESGQEAAIIHRLTQPSDHPVNIFHPEGEYLKGLVLQTGGTL